MYHYVREYDSSYPNFRFLDIKNFCKQLDYLDNKFGFVEKDEWLLYTNSGILPKQSGKVVLTFDDTMRCHYDYVLPELKKRGLWGIFYVPTLPYSIKKILDVHRIHLLCGAFDGMNLLNIALKSISEEMIPDSKIEEFRKETYIEQENYEGVTEFKRILNYFIDYDFREKVIDQIANKIGFEFDVGQFYVQESGLIEMKEYGMVIGSHSNSHPVMSKLSKREQLHEIKHSFQVLTEMGVMETKTYCHPYGGFFSFNTDTLSLLKEEGVLYSFNVESRDIEASDFMNSMQYLPRYDCNLFEHGKAS